MYQYSRAIYRSIKDLIDPYADVETQLESRREVLVAVRADDGAAADDPHYFANPDRTLFQDIRRLLPDHGQAQVAWAVKRGRRRGRRRSSRSRSRPAHSTAASPAARRRPARASLPADAASRAALLPVAPAPRAARRSPPDALARRVRLRSRPARAVSSPAMSHDTDKLIRQLSLVAFLMAERRPLTARDVKQNVEGYSEMSDEAFARRFYSDRAELLALGVPLQSQRDEFTGEELYTLRSEHYFLPPLELTDDELAALQTCLYLLEGKFAYAEPFRLALQNLALGRPGFAEAPTETAVRVEVRDPDYSPELAGRLSKLETAISKQRTLASTTGRSRATRVGERTIDPYALLTRQGQLVRRRARPRPRRDPHVPRLADPRRDPVRDAARARLPAAPGLRRRRAPRPPAWQIGDDRRRGADRARAATRPGGSSARYGDAGRLEDDVFVTPYSSIAQLASWVLRQDGRAVPLEPDALRREVATACGAFATATRGGRRSRRARSRSREAPTAPPSARPAPSRRSDSGFSRPCSRTSSRRAARTRGEIPAQRARRAIPDPGRGARGASLAAQPRQLRRRLLRRLRRAATATVHVDKELCGDTFRSPPRLTPLEARAIRLALEFVGPMIAADAHPPLDARAQEARGDVRAVRARADARAAPTGPRSTSSPRSATRSKRRARRDRVPEGRRGRGRRRTSSSRTGSSASCHTGTSTRGTAPATACGPSGSTGCAAPR